MINISPQIYTQVVDRVLREFPRAFVTNRYIAAPPQFPCVYCAVADSSMFRKSRTNATAENHAAITYRVEVFSNLINGANYEAEDIMSAVDEVFDRLNFTRMSLNEVPNLYDASVYRLVALYRAVVGKDHTIYRR